MNDLRTMIWKEWKDLRSGTRSNFILPLWIAAVMGVALPLSFSLRWINLDPAAEMIILYMPFMLITTFIGDAIAGERERHTLETLLASRISNQAILLGKVLVTVGVCWGTNLVCLLLGAVVVNLSTGPGPWQFYTPINLFLVLLVLSFLTTLLAACGGVLISLKSSTVRQAAQIMLLSEIVLGLVVYGIVRALPASLVASLTTSQIVLIILLAIFVLDVILFAAALASFRRSRLILN